MLLLPSTRLKEGNRVSRHTEGRAQGGGEDLALPAGKEHPNRPIGGQARHHALATLGMLDSLGELEVGIGHHSIVNKQMAQRQLNELAGSECVFDFSDISCQQALQYLVADIAGDDQQQLGRATL